MKKLLVIVLAAIFITSCEREVITNEATTQTFLMRVKNDLKDSLSALDFDNIDVSKAFITKTTVGRRYIRIPFKGKDVSREFVLLQTTDGGKMLSGFIIDLIRNAIEKGKEYEYNGVITKSSLNRRQTWAATLKNGKVADNPATSFASRDFVLPFPKDSTIIVISEDGPTISYSDWINISGIFDYYGAYGADGGYLYAGYYSGNVSSGPLEIGQTNAAGLYSGDTLVAGPLMPDVEAEDLSGIDVSRYINCFSTIPDLGSTCSIRILVDIPVDSDPNKLFDYQLGSPGHTFLEFKKTNGAKTYTQYIGFYPATTWKMLFDLPVDGKIVDNGEHEYNASLGMSVTPDQFNNSLNHLKDISNVKYDIDDYNCTDFALDLFNLSRVGNAIEIPKYNIPGGATANGTSTPGALYNTLERMQQFNIESGGDISIPHGKAYVGTSSGPCN